MLGAGKGVFALIVGMLLAVIVMAIYNKDLHINSHYLHILF